MKLDVIVVTAASDPAPAWVSFAALALSMVALLISTAWAVFTWRRTGEVLSLVGDIRAPLFQSDHRRPVRAGAVHTVLTITARNRGRTPVKVHRLYLASKDTKRRSTFERTERSADLPVTIEARDRVQWYIDPRMLGVLAKTHGNPMAVRPLIEYGPGNWRKGRVLHIRVSEEHLPHAAPRFRSTFGYWVRTLRPKKGVGPFTGTVGTAVVSTQSPDRPRTDSEGP